MKRLNKKKFELVIFESEEQRDYHNGTNGRKENDLDCDTPGSSDAKSEW